MEISGTIIGLLPLQSGQGKNGNPWKKQEFILETSAQYPKKVCISLWGDKVDQHRVNIGDKVTASIDVESREYNGRWYTDVRAWKIAKESAGQRYESAPPAMEPPMAAGGSATDDLPF
jgi:hypothetical protein